MNRLWSILKFIWDHPLASKNRITAFRNFIGWQVSQKLLRQPIVYPFIEESVLLMEKGMAGATGNLYTGLLDFEDMAFVLHVLRKGDLFADVGANIGAYSILASKNAGANVVSVEPIPSTFKRLRKNILLNDCSNLVTVLSCGVGSEKGVLRFTTNRDAVNHVVGNEEVLNSNDTLDIPVDTLDDIFEETVPVIMKIDVEGFECPAFKGAQHLLSSPSFKGVIVELNGSGGWYGYSDDEIEAMLVDYGFHPFQYNPFRRQLTPIKTRGKVNTLYLRDVDWIEERTSSSRKFKVMGQEI